MDYPNPAGPYVMTLESKMINDTQRWLPKKCIYRYEQAKSKAKPKSAFPIALVPNAVAENFGQSDHGKPMTEGLVRGHVIATSLLGPNVMANVVPMYAQTNAVTWKRAESTFRFALTTRKRKKSGSGAGEIQASQLEIAIDYKVDDPVPSRLNWSLKNEKDDEVQRGLVHNYPAERVALTESELQKFMFCAPSYEWMYSDFVSYFDALDLALERGLMGDWKVENVLHKLLPGRRPNKVFVLPHPDLRIHSGLDWLLFGPIDALNPAGKDEAGKDLNSRLLGAQRGLRDKMNYPKSPNREIVPVESVNNFTDRFRGLALLRCLHLSRKFEDSEGRTGIRSDQYVNPQEEPGPTICRFPDGIRETQEMLSDERANYGFEADHVIPKGGKWNDVEIATIECFSNLHIISSEFNGSKSTELPQGEHRALREIKKGVFEWINEAST